MKKKENDLIWFDLILPILRRLNCVVQWLWELRLIVSLMLIPVQRWEMQIVGEKTNINNGDLSNHIKTKRNCFASFREIRCTINTIIKRITCLFITGSITKIQSESFLHFLLFWYFTWHYSFDLILHYYCSRSLSNEFQVTNV